MATLSKKNRVRIYAADLEHERKRLAELISNKTAAGRPVSGQLIARFNRAAAHYSAVSRELAEIERHEAEAVERDRTRKRVFRFFLPGDDISLLKAIARKRHTTASALARILIQQFLIQKGEP